MKNTFLLSELIRIKKFELIELKNLYKQNVHPCYNAVCVFNNESAVLNCDKSILVEQCLHYSIEESD